MFEVKKFSAMEKELDGISSETMANHYKLYEGYVKKSNEILEKLELVDKDPAKANQVFSEIRSLKTDLSFAIGGVKNHEIYFGHLGGDGVLKEGKLKSMLERDFGSIENWQQDLKATGMAARGWVWLAYDYDTGKLFNYLGDAQNTYPIWNCHMVLALDTYEHAYWADYGTNRANYIEAFLKNLDWSFVEDRVSSLN